MTLTPGTRLGPYEIIHLIGAGGMGEVYRARDTRLNRMVAIKRLTAQIDRFEQEARAIAALNHPHICQIHDIGPDYLVLEYIDGVPPRGPLAIPEAVRLAAQMASALEAAHGRGILHRDLKPANILVGSDGTVKLLDFGLAKLMEGDAEVTRTLEGTVLGTAAYMSPEQAEGATLDVRSDIFSFGAVLFELLAGTRAFRGNTTAQVLSAVLRDDPEGLRTSPELDRIVRRCLKKRPSERFQTMGEVRAALELVAVKPVDARPSIAVLAFADMSPGKDQEYFSDGLAEEIINALTQLPGLKVIARTSAFAFKGQSTDIRRIAEALGVTHILEGSVRKAGDRIRVTAQLITAVDGSHLWSERYDRQLADVFAIQDEVAEAIATALRIKLSDDRTALQRYIPALPAYEAFLKARHDLQKWTSESLTKGRENLERALALDPGFALAHSELGWCFFGLLTENCMLPGEAVALMDTHARKALEIDPSLPDAHAVLGLAATVDYNWNEADRRFRLAVAREPVTPAVRYFYSSRILATRGRMKEGEQEMQRLIQDDPLNLLWRAALGMYFVATDRFVEGEATLRQVLELDPTFWLAYTWLGLIRLRRGLLAEALPLIEQAHSLVPSNWFQIGLLAGVLERTGDTTRAAPLIEKLGDGTAFGAPAGLVCYHFVRGDSNKAADWFEKVIAQRDTRAPWIFPYALGSFLMSHPRWPQLARLMNLQA
jgi:TolB-like protein/tRNA A-37 threonylcarbamoyl transferase component Bud32/Tfp pilus assembly protein PilF